MTRSVLDDLGQEITGIVAPVSICMLLTVVLVKALNPEGIADTNSVAIATIAYHEKDTDSAGQKLGGALLNAVIFMAVIGGMTFMLFLLFKWGCYKLIYGYMGFAMFNVFFFLTGALILQLLRLSGVHMDLVSFCFLLFNFSVVGILSLFFLPVPLLLKQCYTVWVGIIMAYIFTHVPEWTSWVLLVIMALYDLAAVLLPGGPLKILVELAIERQQELPALVYEARPTQGPYQRGMWRNRQQPANARAATGGPNSSTQAAEGASVAAGTSAGVGLGAAAVAPLATIVGAGMGDGDSSPSHRVALLAGQVRSSGDRMQELALTPPGVTQALGVPATAAAVTEGRGASSSSSSGHCSREHPEAAARPSGAATAAAAAAGARGRVVEQENPADTFPAAGAVAPAAGAAGSGRAVGPPTGPTGFEAEEDEESEGSVGLPDAIKLGLGDFIFYSMLVGRAAMYDFMTVYTSYLAVIAGLVTTLLLLALARKALPALPVSIALGVLFYFLTRLVMEPVVVPLALNLTYY